MSVLKKLAPKKVINPIYSLIIIGCVIGGFVGVYNSGQAAPTTEQSIRSKNILGSQVCAGCHSEILDQWQTTRHANAFSSPIFQRDWTKLGSRTSCLSCHTTGFNSKDGTYTEEGVSCEACHGPMQEGHPKIPMPMTPSAELCGTCHKTTTDEWRASPHQIAGIQCQACHNPHSQTPMADTITALCGNCHKLKGDSFTHSTHAEAGLECSNCHMYKSPRFENPIEGLVPTGHTFAVGSEACIGCHQDTVHTRNELLKISDQGNTTSIPDQMSLEKKIHQQELSIKRLESQSSVRLYTGLIQGSIIGLIIGGTVAWLVGSRIRVVEITDEEKNES